MKNTYVRRMYRRRNEVKLYFFTFAAFALVMGTAFFIGQYRSAQNVVPANITPSSTAPVSAVDESQSMGSLADPFGNQNNNASALVPAGDMGGFKKIPADDVDFTLLDNTEFWDVFYNMMGFQDEYLGKTIKISGEYVRHHDEEKDEWAHFLMFADEMGCCTQYLEFLRNGDRTTDGYPNFFDVVEIEGIVSDYYDEELEWTFYFLNVDDINILQEAV